MKNSYACSILGLYRGIFADARSNLPTVRGLERDESRLLSTVKSRGIRYLTIDLPAFGKHFDKCLAEGRLVPSGVPTFGYSRSGGRGHAFLRGLILRVFDTDGLLLSQPCVTSIFFLRQLFNGAKKIKVDATEKVREQSLIQSLQQELSIRPPSLNWFGDRPDSRFGVRLHLDDVHHDDGERNLDLFENDFLPAAFCDTVHRVADRVFSSFGEFNPDEWRPKHGPGAVADRVGKGFKYAFPTWSQRLDVVFPLARFGYANYSNWVDDVRQDSGPTQVEVPAFVLAVPKTQVAVRIISKEPTAAMWCQQIVRDYLETNVGRSVLRNCISFRDQSLNADLALQASLTQSHWTVDLSNASDRLSLWLIERLVRTNKSLLEALWASRSIYCKADTKQGSELIRMKKFAPQGSATTFPLQTIVYAVLAIASLLYARGLPVTTRTLRMASKEVRVFGDDSIVPDDCGRQYVDLLTYCGFSVNPNKTFTTGRFRESCGTEAWDGVDVTPAYITYPYEESAPSSVASVVECSNNFYKKGLWHAAAALESTLPFWVRKYLKRVGPGDGSFGLFTYVGSQSTGIVRYNEKLHREESLSLCVESRVSRSQPGGTGHLLQYFTEAPTQDINWMSGVDDRPVLRVAKRWEALAA